MSPHVSYNPEAANRAFLPQAGTYGPGCEHEADVTIYSVKVAEPDSPDAPFDDKKCEKDSYTVWNFQVVYDGKVVFARSRAQANTMPNSGSKNLAWFANLGLQPTESPDGTLGFDLDKLTGLKCRIKVGKPRQNKEDASIWYTGAVSDVFGLGS